ncbi:MAG: DUF1961 family protein, partial [Candidatus Hydrogenedentota bacterium]
MISRREPRRLTMAACWVTAMMLCGLFSEAYAISGSVGGEDFEIGELIYENPLSSEEDIEDVVIESSEEGQPEIRFENGRMRLESDVHFLFWFPHDFPDHIAVSWDFLPEVDDCLAMFWFCAKGREGEELF